MSLKRLKNGCLRCVVWRVSMMSMLMHWLS